MKMSGAEMLLESLKRENVQHIFGYPGGVVLPIFDALFKDPSLQVVLTRHEQGAVHAAEGYARSTNKVGVVLVTSGPGATNTVTGLAAANMAIHHCDLLIAVGVRFDDRVTGKISEFSPHSKVIHIDIDPTSIRKNFHVDIPIVGDAKHILKDLIEEIKELNKPEPPSKEKLIDPWIEQVEEWEKEHPLTYEHDTEVIKPQYVIEKVYQFTQGDCIVSTDVGQHQMWTAQFFKFIKPNTWLTSGGLGTMGYGFPAAIGAQKAHPDKRLFYGIPSWRVKVLPNFVMSFF